jgi:phage terminase large subunit-like protein
MFAFDPWNAENLTQDIETETGIERREFAQTLKNFAGPCDEYERLLRLGKMRQNGNKILGWQTSHVKVKSDFNNNKRPVKPAKGKADDYKTIDGICADLMALGLWIEEPEAGDDPEVLVI